MRGPAMVGTALVLAPLLAAAGCTGGQAAPVAGATLLRIEQEIEIGRAAAPDFEQAHGGRLDDLAVQAYVRTIGERLSRCTPLHGLPYQFTVLDDASPLAAALPGGPVYVTRGLLARLRTEGELAAAMAHELAHINARHVGREMRRRLGEDVLREAIDAGVRRRAAEKVPAASARALARVVAEAGALEYAPDVQAEADRLGLDYLVAAGYNPREMIGLLQSLGSTADTDVSTPSVMAVEGNDRLGGIRRAIEAKYPDRGGRVAEDEFRREVLERLKGR